MTYEIRQNHKYTLRYHTKVKAATNHLMMYPISYQWTGSGDEEVPKLSNKGQELLTPIQRTRKARLRPAPYKISSSLIGEWSYWFISLTPPLHKDDVTEIKYSQDFTDKKKSARPYLRYFVRIPIKKLELHIKFPSNNLPSKVTSGYYKPSDPTRFRVK